MRVRPELDPDVDDQAPDGPDITIYDEAHFVTYLRLLDAERDGADWTEVARIVLHRDPACEELRTRRCFESHLARAHWMTKRGYRRLLEQSVDKRAAPDPDRQNFENPADLRAMLSGGAISVVLDCLSPTG